MAQNQAPYHAGADTLLTNTKSMLDQAHCIHVTKDKSIFHILMDHCIYVKMVAVLFSH